ncbi:unnamed protein product [Laminaria digitata]
MATRSVGDGVYGRLLKVSSLCVHGMWGGVDWTVFFSGNTFMILCTVYVVHFYRLKHTRYYKINKAEKSGLNMDDAVIGRFWGGSMIFRGVLSCISKRTIENTGTKMKRNRRMARIRTKEGVIGLNVADGLQHPLL